MIQVPFNAELAKEITEGRKFGLIKTRDGFNVRLLTFGVRSRYCIAGVVELGDDEYVKQWTIDGKADYRPNVKTNYDLELFVEGGES
jgi:hypothetical protein